MYRMGQLGGLKICRGARGGDTYKNSKLFLKFYLDQENFVEKKETVTNFGIKVRFLKYYSTHLLHSSRTALHDYFYSKNSMDLQKNNAYLALCLRHPTTILHFSLLLNLWLSEEPVCHECSCCFSIRACFLLDFTKDFLKGPKSWIFHPSGVALHDELSQKTVLIFRKQHI